MSDGVTDSHTGGFSVVHHPPTVVTTNANLFHPAVATWHPWVRPYWNPYVRLGSFNLVPSWPIYPAVAAAPIVATAPVATTVTVVPHS